MFQTSLALGGRRRHRARVHLSILVAVVSGLVMVLMVVSNLWGCTRTATTRTWSGTSLGCCCSSLSRSFSTAHTVFFQVKHTIEPIPCIGKSSAPSVALRSPFPSDWSGLKLRFRRIRGMQRRRDGGNQEEMAAEERGDGGGRGAGSMRWHWGVERWQRCPSQEHPWVIGGDVRNT
jgi:hypothetical protein